jgi:hypothetical protein
MYNDGKRIILGFLANIYKRLRASVIFIRTFIPYSTMKMKHHHKLTTATLLAGIGLIGLASSYVAWAAPQDNWYKSATWGGVSGAVNMIVTADGLIWIAGNNKIVVHEQNGTLVKQFTTGLTGCLDVALDSSGNVYAAVTNQLIKMDANGSQIWAVSRSNIRSVYLRDNGKIYANHNNGFSIYASDGNMTKTFSNTSVGTSIFDARSDRAGAIRFLPNGNYILYHNAIRYFDQNDTFIQTLNGAQHPKTHIAVSPEGLYYCSTNLYDPNTNTVVSNMSGIYNQYDKCAAFTPKGDLVIARGNDTIDIWTRTYRTHGTVVRNVPPQPRITVTQRVGTNLVDMDVEIVDPDDGNATFAILGAVDSDFADTSKWFVPTFTEGTGAKIDTLLPTNQVHRLTWNTRANWTEIDGTFQFQVLCRDARRAASPVDLHFMTLPVTDGNLTISRSPLEDSDFETHYKYELAAGRAEVDGGNMVSKVGALPQGATRYVFTNCGATGRYGPTWGDVNGSYLGTNLEGNVSMGAHQGIQIWDVPAAGKYMIEVAGAGGSSTGKGAYASGTFDFNGSETLKILVGQKGTGRAGSGGTFVTLIDNTPIVIAGGAAFAGSNADGRAETSGAGEAGAYQNDGGGGAGLLQEVNTPGGKSFINGGVGGKDSTGQDPNDPIGQNLGGFGGGGGSRVGSGHTGGGGGYSGGSGIGTGSPWGGRSFNADSNGVKSSGSHVDHGRVIITKLPTGTTAVRGMQQILVKSNLQVTELGRHEMFGMLGYDEANGTQLTQAREAGVPGSAVKQWDPRSQVRPTNLPGKVNAWGFDTEHTTGRYWWAVKN